MNQKEIRSAVLELLALALKKPLATEQNVCRAAEPAWDSLKHVELILLLEERFGILFTEEEMGAMTSVADIVARIEAKYAA